MPRLGSHVVGIVEMQSTGHVDGKNQNITNPVVTQVVKGCMFESYIRGPEEHQEDTITSFERAYAFLPYIEGVTTTITNANWLQPQRPDAQAQRNYKVLGDPIVQYDSRGRGNHVWIVCEWRAG
jgi:hypothetical protein